MSVLHEPVTAFVNENRPGLSIDDETLPILRRALRAARSVARLVTLPLRGGLIGDTVNLASRLESAIKELGVEILVSEYTSNALRGVFRFRQTGSVTVRGRSEAVLTYTPEDETTA